MCSLQWILRARCCWIWVRRRGCIADLPVADVRASATHPSASSGLANDPVRSVIFFFVPVSDFESNSVPNNVHSTVKTTTSMIIITWTGGAGCGRRCGSSDDLLHLWLLWSHIWKERQDVRLARIPAHGFTVGASYHRSRHCDSSASMINNRTYGRQHRRFLHPFCTCAPLTKTRPTIVLLAHRLTRQVLLSLFTVPLESLFEFEFHSLSTIHLWLVELAKIRSVSLTSCGKESEWIN